jgi:energy-converting hydrogenase A subunit P
VENFFSSTVALDTMKCLRGDYAYNECSKCIDICPFDAFISDNRRLAVSSDICISCLACIGVCPTESIEADGFDTNSFILSEIAKEQNELQKKTLDKGLVLKCTALGACLAAFDEQHLISLVLRSSREVLLDCNECEKCPLNENSKEVLNQIELVAAETNRFLKACESGKQIAFAPKVDDGRRGFFRSLLKGATSIKEAATYEKPNVQSKIPLKTVILKNTLKDLAESLKLKIDEGDFSFLPAKNISDTCSNCKMCIEFCPTKALFYSDDTSKIYFQSGKCVSCSICNDVCKDKSFSDDSETDLVRFMFDKAKCLIAHTIIECDHCKIGFSSKNGDTTCHTCKLFKTDFATMFLTAEEIEGRLVN